MRRTGYRSRYVDIKGEEHDYTAADQTDMERQHLVVNYNEAAFKRTTVPVSININFSANQVFQSKDRTLPVRKQHTGLQSQLRGQRGENQKESSPLFRHGIEHQIITPIYHEYEKQFYHFLFADRDDL